MYVKLDFNLKNRWELGTYVIPAPEGFTPHGVESRNSMGISCYYDKLNSTNIFAISIRNKCL